VDAPVAIWVHYEYVHCGHLQTATQRIHLDLPDFKCERLAHLTNYIFTKGYLPCKARSLVSWKAACGKHVEESTKVEDVLSWGEGTCEDKPLRLVIGEYLRALSRATQVSLRILMLAYRLVSQLRSRTLAVGVEAKLALKGRFRRSVANGECVEHSATVT
jgi:hypothetical protein